jgi:predicted flap endonuclease-1-like 5' DNA nuclease
MSIGIGKIRGITLNHAKTLRARSIKNSETLIEQAKTPKARKALAAATGIAENTVLELANRADLARVKGIGEVFSNMLEEAGVDTVKELAKRKPANLHAALVEINAKGKYAKRDATMAEVTDWIDQAKTLPKTLTY